MSGDLSDIQSLVLESGHTVELIPEDENKIMEKNYYSYHEGCIRLRPEGWFFSKTFAKFANLVYNFKVKPTDTYVVAFPKSGINWIQEIVWNLIHNPDLDNPEANTSIDTRCPFYEIDFAFNIEGMPVLDPNGELMTTFKQLFPDKDPKDGLFTHLAAFAPDPRVIKNHLACSLLPPEMFKKSKVVYLARDIRDIIISAFHFFKLHLLARFHGTLDELVDDYIGNRAGYGPYWEHLRQAWERRNDPNFLFVFYEDLKADPQSEIKRIDQFLGTERTDQQIDNIVDFTSFENMKERTKDNPPTSMGGELFDKEVQKEGGSYFRKGKAGSWKEEFPPEITEKVNSWMKENLIKFGPDFKYKV